MILRSSKFFGFCYADGIGEKEFFGKNFNIDIDKDCLKISFQLMRGLDVINIKYNIKEYTFFEIEDNYLKNKLIQTLNESPQVKKLFLLKGTDYYPIKHLKLTRKGFVIRLV